MIISDFTDTVRQRIEHYQQMRHGAAAGSEPGMSAAVVESLAATLRSTKDMVLFSTGGFPQLHQASPPYFARAARVPGQPAGQPAAERAVAEHAAAVRADTALAADSSCTVVVPLLFRDSEGLCFGGLGGNHSFGLLCGQVQRHLERPDEMRLAAYLG